jgi:hypothetical protein
VPTRRSGSAGTARPRNDLVPILLPQWHERVGFIHISSAVTRQLTMRRLTVVLDEELSGFYAHVGEFSKVLIRGGHWRVFGRSGCRYQTVHEMNLRFSIAVQSVEMNSLLLDLNARARDESAQRRSDICTRMLVKRIQYKHALGQNSWRHHDH